MAAEDVSEVLAPGAPDPQDSDQDVLLPEAAGPVAFDFEDPADLPPQPEPPALLTTFSGDAVSDAERWRSQRVPELKAILEHYVYGRLPPPRAGTVTLESTAAVLGGTVTLDQYAVGVEGAPELAIHVAVFRPPGDGPHPVWLALNACGNQTVLAVEAVRVTTAYREPNCGVETAAESRGTQASKFPIALIVERGWAIAAIHQSEIAPDDQSAGSAAFRALIEVDGPEETRWGVLQAWAYGVAHVARAVPGMTGLDPKRVAVAGHSRRGKVALLAAAQEPAIGLVVSHQSGTAGGRMSRSEVGEAVEAITLVFPHWFDAHFPAFARRETSLPLDQHFLLALVAPRPLLLSNGVDDNWAGPEGTRQATHLASAAWTLLGATGVGEDNDLSTPLAYHVRPGGHSLGAEDWETFLDFAEGKL